MAEPRIERLFVCIGAQKSGTTWLAKILSTHPDLFFTPVKEIHYFDHVRGITTHLSGRRRRSRLRKHYQRLLTQWGRFGEINAQRAWYRDYMRSPIDDRWYAQLFVERGGRSFAAEATPEYALIGEEGFAHLKRIAPDARILYILRNPVDRAWSQLLHYCRRQRIDPARTAINKLIAITKEPSFAAHGEYLVTMDTLSKVFPRNQISIEFYEDMHADRLAAIERVCRFIGLQTSAAFGDLQRRYNVSQDETMPGELRRSLRKRYAPLAREVEQRLGRVPQHWREEFAMHDASEATRKSAG